MCFVTLLYAVSRSIPANERSLRLAVLLRRLPHSRLEEVLASEDLVRQAVPAAVHERRDVFHLLAQQQDLPARSLGAGTGRTPVVACVEAPLISLSSP